MLTDPLLVGHVTSGALVPWKPLAGVLVRPVRTMLLTPEVFSEVYADPWPREPEDRSDRDARERRRIFHGEMARLVGGERMAPDAHIKLLDPRDDAIFQDLFELRSGPPRPQSRLLTYVYEPGVWVGVGFDLRSELGDKGDPRWQRAAQDARSAWDALFPGRPPKRTTYPCDTFTKLKAYTDG